MSIMGKQVTIGQLLSILVAILIPVVGWLYSLGVNQATHATKIAEHDRAIIELKDDKKETNKKLDTIIQILTDLRVQVANKQDRPH